MALTTAKLRPWILFLSRDMSISVSNSGIEFQKCINTHIYLNSHGIHNCYQRPISYTLKNNFEEGLKKEFNFEYDHNECLRKKAVSNMKKLFGLKPKSAQSLVSKCPDLKFVSLEGARRNVDYFTDKGLSVETLKENPWLLTYKIETITSALEILNKLELGDLKTILPLLKLTLCRLKENSETEEKESDLTEANRIKYTCEKLQCGLAEVCKIFEEHDFLCSIPFAKYSYIMDKLLDAGISPSHILRDVWVFQYGIKKIENRLKVLKEVGVNPVKPWMLRSSPKIFDTTVKRVLSRKEVLGENSIVEFLTEQLECDVKTVELLASKYPVLLKKHVPKLKEVLDFLYAEGFTPQQVIQVPRILFHSVETINSRLTELREAGSNPASLMTLCKSKHEFSKIVEVALKRKLRVQSDT